MGKESDNGISSKVYYRGDTVFLYTKFRDENNNIIKWGGLYGKSIRNWFRNNKFMYGYNG